MWHRGATVVGRYVKVTDHTLQTLTDIGDRTILEHVAIDRGNSAGKIHFLLDTVADDYYFVELVAFVGQHHRQRLAVPFHVNCGVAHTGYTQSSTFINTCERERPSISVDVPLFVPMTNTEAPTIGSPVESVTVLITGIPICLGHADCLLSVDSLIAASCTEKACQHYFCQLFWHKIYIRG